MVPGPPPRVGSEVARQEQAKGRPMTYLLWFGMVVAIWRITRLLVKEDFPPVERVRDWFIETFGRRNSSGDLAAGKRWGIVGYSIAYVWTCMWCMSVWVGIGAWAVASLWLGLYVPYPALLIAAGSGLAGIIGALDERIDQRYELARLEIKRKTEESER
jgi:hypothetical protein